MHRLQSINLCLCLLLLGCSEGVSEASLITYVRVLGVRVEVNDDPERATPSIDEDTTARVLVMGPDGAAEVSYAMDVCAALPANGALPACASGSLFASASVEPVSEPMLHWSGLSRDQIGDANELLLRGTICEQGTPALDPTRPGECSDPTFNGVSFVQRVTLLDADQAPNQHPTLAAARLRFDDAAWDSEGCSASVERDGKEHALSISLHDANREAVDDTAETLLLSWFINVGELDQHFSVLESEQDQDEPLSVTWTAPRADDDIMQDVATVTLVLRDQRGGITWAQRQICMP